jgi:hypothetical protein
MEPAKKEEEKIDSKESSNSKTSKESKLEGFYFLIICLEEIDDHISDDD